MKSKLFLTLAAGLFLAATAPRLAAADAGQQTTLTGTMVCGKCKLHITKQCQDVLQVEKDGKTVNYYLSMNKVAKDFHSNICQTDGEKVTVTGKVKKEGGKEMLVASKIKADE
ncbi:MAG: hypothetical protein KGJ60_04370 [Verrucomicrobiota bacterium]|nr:hypothetical protein [Verrucomicrobiota bacterium]